MIPILNTPTPIHEAGRGKKKNKWRDKENRPQEKFSRSLPWKEGLARAGKDLKQKAQLGLIPHAENVEQNEAVLADDSPTEDLKVIADRKMAEEGLYIDFNSAVRSEVAAVKGPAVPDPNDKMVRDLRHLPWNSIDNGELDPATKELLNASMDIDQVTTAERLPDGRIKVYVGIADVDSLVKKESASDKAAAHNTSTVYTDDKIYPMIHPDLSEGFTSLNEGEDRLAMVKEYVVAPDGTIEDGDVYEAWVHNHAKMAYEPVNDWMNENLEGASGQMAGPVSPPLEDPVMAEQVRLQDEAAQRIKKARFGDGALTLESQETRGQTGQDGEVVELKRHKQNRAHELIENLMVAANQVTARFLEERGYPSPRRAVVTPEKWPKIVDLVENLGGDLPKQPDSKALNDFLMAKKEEDPRHFMDLSLKMVKLLGRGEYHVDDPENPAPGHFCLAVLDYAHSTAPNRRYADLVLQRIEKAAFRGEPCPYTTDELGEVTTHINEQEEKIENKVERKVNKSAQAKLMKPLVGETFEGIVTNTGRYGTWVRLEDPPVEGKVVEGGKGLEELQHVPVKLLGVKVEKGHIDFEVKPGPAEYEGQFIAG